MGIISDKAYIYRAVDAALSFGENVQIEPFASIICKKEITIGRDTIIAPGVVIVDFDHDITDASKVMLDGIAQSVNIGRNVWIGANAVVLKGVNIGDNAVIGAGSIVTHDVPKDEIWVGNPARYLRKRDL